MPLISIKVLKGALTDDQKKEMIAKVTETVAEIEAGPSPKENLQPYVWCIIEEVEFGNWGVGGVPVTPDMLKGIIEGKSP